MWKEAEGMRASVDADLCTGCELCVEHCSGNALSLYRDADKTVPLDLDIIKNEYAEYPN